MALSAAPQRCEAKTRADDAHPCKQYAVEGATRCRFHGGASPQAKKAAKRRIAEERAAAVLRTEPAEPVVDPVGKLRQLAAEVLLRADAALEAGQTTGSVSGEWVDRAMRLLVELAKIDGRYVERSAVLSMDVTQDFDLDRKIEEAYGKLVSKPTQARLNTLYDAMDATDSGEDVDAAVEKGIETRRKVPAALMVDVPGGSSLEDVPGVSVEVYVTDHPPDEPDQPPESTSQVVGLGKLPSGFGVRRPHPPAG